MGCGASDTKDENPNEEEMNFFESKDQIAIREVTKKQNEIIDKFNQKKGNSNNVGLSNITSCYIKFWNSSKGTKYTIESNAENILKFLEKAVCQIDRRDYAPVYGLNGRTVTLLYLLHGGIIFFLKQSLIASPYD